MRICSVCNICYEDAAVSCVEENHPLLPETREGDPEMIAGFRIERLAESNARGEIYSARQIECGRACLIKILPANEAKQEHFLSEARSAAAIFHANVADVYDSGVLETGELFVVAEDAESETLRELIDTGVPVDLLTAIRIIRQAAEAVHALHLNGLTHGAVRPENIVLIEDASAQPLVKMQNPDLGGLARHAIVSNKFSIDSELDSLKYFAPEKCSGDEAGPQADVYGLGIVFYEMLSGRPPFEAGNAMALIEKHKSQPPPDIKINNFELRMLVTHTLMESLQKQPRFRQSSANAFARQLRHIEQLATHMATPPPAGIVPPAPRRLAPRVSVAIDSATSASIAPSVRVEIPAAMRVEMAPRVAAAFEDEPIHIAATLDVGSLAEVRAEIAAHLSSEPPIENLAEIETVPSVPKRSRLKLHRKRTQQKPLPMAFDMPNVIVAAMEEMPAEHAMPAINEAVSIHVEPTRVEWEQPEDDIPSVEDIVEVLRLEQIAEISVVEARETRVERPEPKEEPVIVETRDTIAVAKAERAAVLKEIQPVLAESEARVEQKVEPEKLAVIPTARKAEPERDPADVEEQEEITLVRAPGSQIRIDLDKPLPWKKWSFDGERTAFVPTILGDGKHGAIDPDTRDSMFAAYFDKPRLPFVTGRRVAAIGAPLALIVMFLFGNDLVTKYLQARSSDESAAVKTTETSESSPPAGRTKSVKKPARRNLKEVSPEKDARVSLRTAVTRSNEKPTPSRTEPKAKPEVKRAEAKTPTASARPVSLTRPRVVPNPKP